MIVAFVAGLSLGVLLAVGFLSYCLWRSWKERLAMSGQAHSIGPITANSDLPHAGPNEKTYH
jgi:hypothetical protein